MSNGVFYVTQEAWRKALREGRVRFEFETLPMKRGWEHEFSAAPVARRKRVAGALFRAVTK